ncbi:MAG: acetate--CoA ligase family protein [Symbiobacteriaceae bacterium]|nr:acetate--CoA ligase family protein [Symbiobacteriaceae bacterium]
MTHFLNEAQSNTLLSRHGIPMIPYKIVHSPEQAQEAAGAMGGSLALKILSAHIWHKSEVGGVMLGVEPSQAGEAYRQLLTNVARLAPTVPLEGVMLSPMLFGGLELVLGLKKDPQFGFILLAGMGGLYLELYNDTAIRLAPVTLREARQMVAELKVKQIIDGSRGTVYDEEALLAAMVALSQLGEVLPELSEVDINPFFLFAQGQGAVGADALVGINKNEIEEEE